MSSGTSAAALRRLGRAPSVWAEKWKSWNFRRQVRARESELGRPILPVDVTDPGAPQHVLWERMRACLPAGDARFAMRDVALDGPLGQRLGAHWERFGSGYSSNGAAAREKALEHALSFELLDFSRVARYCDVASDASQVERACAVLHPGVEVFRQDLQYQSDLAHRIIGGYAQDMRDVRAGFFDALTLHCSYEHFAGRADVDFITEVDRVLGPAGACLIVPLYVGDRHCVYFDPKRVRNSTLAGYDAEAELYAATHYHEEHGRYYSPESLSQRVLAHLPTGLHATLLRFQKQKSIDASIYIRFGLILHRPESIVRCPADALPG